MFIPDQDIFPSRTLDSKEKGKKGVCCIDPFIEAMNLNILEIFELVPVRYRKRVESTELTKNLNIKLKYCY
jgi:hypothetical protein